MIQTLVLSSILLIVPAQAGSRGPSMLGGKPAPRAKTDGDRKPASPPAARDQAATKSTEPPGARSGDDRDSGDALAAYNGMREKTPHTVAAQSKLAAWCEEHGLKAEAYVHYAEVVRLDPKREAAWRKLGYKKYGNRWMTDPDIAEAEEQKKADRTWAPEIKKIHKDIHGSHGARKRDQARTALDAIADPRAIPSLYREFAGRSQTDQIMLIEVLGRIDRPLGTEVLAMMSVFGGTAEVRRRAAEVLRGRRSSDYIELLVGLMIDPLKYEVKPVGGPGSPGILVVEGQQFNVARFYAPPTPILPVMPGLVGSQVLKSSETMKRTHQGAIITDTQTVRDAITTYSMEDILMEQRKATAVAESQLEGDLAVIKAINSERRRFNDMVITVLSYATGKDVGPAPKDWRDALAAGPNSRKAPARPSVKPTFTEMIPVMYTPVVLPRLSFMTATTTHSYVDT